MLEEYQNKSLRYQQHVVSLTKIHKKGMVRH